VRCIQSSTILDILQTTECQHELIAIVTFSLLVPEIISKAITYMGVWMHVIREMEVALNHCTNATQQQSKFHSLASDKVFLHVIMLTASPLFPDSIAGGESAHSWDRAVAFYTGSTQSFDGGTGNMLYDVAEKACSTMNTCLNSSGGAAYVNYFVFQQFEQGQRKLLDGKCEEAQNHKENISTLMTIPLIQRAIRYAHVISDETSIGGYNEKHAAQGAAYALSVLPLVYSCSSDDAKIIHDNLKPTEDPVVDFAAVKSAFERNYECLGVLCSEIGGVWNGDEYFIDAFPCDNDMPQSVVDDDSSKKEESKDSTGLMVVLILLGVLIVGLLLMLIVRTFRKSEVQLDTGKLERGSIPDERPCPELVEPEDKETVFQTEVI
jgi:hypothetical protein